VTAATRNKWKKTIRMPSRPSPVNARASQSTIAGPRHAGDLGKAKEFAAGLVGREFTDEGERGRDVGADGEADDEGARE